MPSAGTPLGQEPQAERQRAKPDREEGQGLPGRHSACSQLENPFDVGRMHEENKIAPSVIETTFERRRTFCRFC